MPFTPSGIFYRRLPGSPTLEATTDGRSASEILMVPWSFVDHFIDESLPPAYALGGFLLRPSRRIMPGRAYMQCDKISVAPFYSDLPGDDPFMPLDTVVEAASWAQVTVSYKTAETEDEDEQDPETFLTQRLSIGAEYLTVPVKAIKWTTRNGEPLSPSTSDLPANYDSLTPAEQEAAKQAFKERFSTTTETLVTKIIPTIEHQLTWKSVVRPPFRAMRKLVGKINNKSLFGAEPETLLFMGADAQREFTRNGVKPWTLDYRFTERSIVEGGITYGWNHFLKPETGRWERVEIGNQPVYQKDDLKKLFQPE